MLIHIIYILIHVVSIQSPTLIDNNENKFFFIIIILLSHSIQLDDDDDDDDSLIECARFHIFFLY